MTFTLTVYSNWTLCSRSILCL